MTIFSLDMRHKGKPKSKQQYTLTIRAPNNSRYAHHITDSWESVESSIKHYFDDIGGVENFAGNIYVNVAMIAGEEGKEI